MDFGFNSLMPNIIDSALDTFDSFSGIVFLLGGMALTFFLVTILIAISKKVKK